MRCHGRFLALCLLLVLLPLRSLLAAGQLGCEAMPPMTQAHAAAPAHAHAHQHGDEHHADLGDAHAHGAKPCKLCAPCCLAAAPPPVSVLAAVSAGPAARVARAPAEAWAGIVPPLPDPPPRA